MIYDSPNRIQPFASWSSKNAYWIVPALAGVGLLAAVIAVSTVFFTLNGNAIRSNKQNVADSLTYKPVTYGENVGTVVASQYISNIIFGNDINVVQKIPNSATFPEVEELSSSTVTGYLSGNLQTPGVRVAVQAIVLAPDTIGIPGKTYVQKRTISPSGGSLYCVSGQNQIANGGAYLGCDYNFFDPPCRMFVYVDIPGNWTTGTSLTCRWGTEAINGCELV